MGRFDACSALRGGWRAAPAARNRQFYLQFLFVGLPADLAELSRLLAGFET